MNNNPLSEALAAWLDPTIGGIEDSLSNFQTTAVLDETLRGWGINDAAPDQRSPHLRAFIDRELAALQRVPAPGEASGLDDETLAVRLAHQAEPNERLDNDEAIAALLLQEEFQRLLNIHGDAGDFLHEQRNALRRFGHNPRLRQRRLEEQMERAKQRAIEASEEAAASMASPSASDLKTEVLTWGDVDDLPSSRATRVTYFRNLPVLSVVAGVHVSAVLTTSGDVFTWGAGQPLPTPLLTDGMKIAQLACGRNHVLLLTNAGNVLAYGDNHAGQLGLPLAVTGVSVAGVHALIDQPANVSYVAAGAAHSACVTAAGQLYTWGSNSHGQLAAVLPLSASDRPQRVELDVGMEVATVACGAAHTVALTVYGDVLQWGAVATDHVAPRWVDLPLSPPGLPAKLVQDIASGWSHVLALTSRGTVFSWGADSFGQLGHGTTSSSSSSFSSSSTFSSSSSSSSSRSQTIRQQQSIAGTAGQVAVNETVAQISAGAYHSAAVSVRGDVYMWGRNTEGQLGVAATLTPSSSAPFLLGSVANFSMRQVSCGYSHTLAVSSMIRPLCYDLRLLLSSPTFSDVGISIHDKLLRLHRCVLAARSPYFRQIFAQHPRISSLTVSSVPYDAFFPVVEYIYSGTAHVPPALLEQVYIIARNLGVAQLEAECLQQLAQPPAPAPYFMGGDRVSSLHVQTAVQELLTTGLLSDLTICFPCGARLDAHRAVLSTRVPYFQQMLSAHWGGADVSTITVTAVSPAVFQHILDYAYGRTVAFSADTVVDVMLAANEYQVPQLQNHCELYISDAIDLDNVLPLMTIAELASPYLFQVCLTYAADRIADIETSKAYAALPRPLRQTIEKKARRIKQRVVARPAGVSASALLHELADPFTAERYSDDEEADIEEDAELSMYIRRQ